MIRKRSILNWKSCFSMFYYHAFQLRILFFCNCMYEKENCLNTYFSIIKYMEILMPTVTLYNMNFIHSVGIFGDFDVLQIWIFNGLCPFLTGCTASIVYIDIFIGLCPLLTGCTSSIVCIDIFIKPFYDHHAIYLSEFNA